MVDEQAIGARVKNSIIGIIRGTGEITQAAVETVASTVQSAIKETGGTGAAAGSAAVGAVKGAIDAVGDVTGQAAETAADGVTAAVESASKVGASVGNAAKGAVMLLTRAMARDHGGDGIRVNAVCPGDVITPMLEDEAHQIGVEPAAMYAESVAGTPLGRIGVPEDIAGAILFLASDDAGLVTGAGLVLDGASSA